MYKAIARNKRNTVILISLFIVLFLIIATPFYYLAYDSYYMSYNDEDTTATYLFIALAITIFSVIFPIVTYKSAMKQIMKVTGAKEVSLETAPELYHIIRSLSIGEGFNNVPKIFVIEDDAPNAFATGQDPQRSSVCVTTGLLKIMDERELRAVLAHEISHIKNYDIRVSMTVFALVGTIVVMCEIIRSIAMRAFFSQSRRRNSNNQSSGVVAVLFVGFWLLMSIIVPLLAGLIQLAVSRQREFLADESGAHLVNDPDSLISALNKLRKYGQPMQKQSTAAAHLFFNEPLKVSSLREKMFSTHPPLEKRIERLMATKNRMNEIGKVNKEDLKNVLNG